MPSRLVTRAAELLFGYSLYCPYLSFAGLPPPPTATTTIAQFGGSIFLGGPWDWEEGGGGGGQQNSRCFQMVDRLAEYPNIRLVQFVPTFYWWDNGPAQPLPPNFDASCRNSTLSSYYCYSRFNATTMGHWCYTRTGDGACDEVTQQEIESFKQNVGACMKYAASKGFSLAVNARVDDGRSLGGWRNTLNFSPVEKYGAFTYEEAVLNPLADIMAAAVATLPAAEIDFVLQGEMGATLYFHPEDWIAVIARIRQRMTAARGGAETTPSSSSSTKSTKIGLGINNSKACGCEYIGIVDAYEYLGNLTATFDPSRYPNLPAVKQVYQAADFLAISAYIPMPAPQFQVCELEGLLTRMDTELALYNIGLGELASAGTELVFSEYGVGGGTSQNGDVAAKTAQEAAETPFFGISADAYTCEKDPFDMCHAADTVNSVRDYRRYFYNKTAEYFALDGNAATGNNGCRYAGDVKKAYIWGTGSWDVLSIYPGSRSSQGSWSDPVVTEGMNSHNLRAQLLQ